MQLSSSVMKTVTHGHIKPNKFYLQNDKHYNIILCHYEKLHAEAQLQSVQICVGFILSENKIP